MENSIQKTRLSPFEIRILTLGFILAGIVIGIVAISYLINSPFSPQWLVWLIGIAFGAVALLLLEWPRAFRSKKEAIAPKGRMRIILLSAIPLAFILDSQICGLGFKACSIGCHVISYSLIGLSIITAYQLFKEKSVGGLLIALIVLSLIPHCVCEAPINALWHSWLVYAPTCQVIPLATTLFAITAIKGRRSRLSIVMVIVLLIMTVFIVVGNAIWGFPWKGCTYLGN